MKSPFPYEHCAQKQDFFGRIEELNNINKITDSSNNLLLHSKRRMGKTSLVKKFLSTQKNKIGIYVDIFDITSPEDFAKILLKEIASVQKGDVSTVVKKLPKLFKRLRFSLGVDSTTGEINYLPSIKDLRFEELIEEIFDALFSMAKDNEIILVIDEFQQVALFKDKKIDALLRKYMMKDMPISYVFLGSKRHILFELFQYKSPLFEMATQMELECIKKEDYYSYIKDHLIITKELIDEIIDITDCETKLTQHICHIIHRDYKNKDIELEYINDALKEVLESKNGSFSALFDTFTLNKKKAFKILTTNDGNYFRQELLTEYGITRQALMSSLKQLFSDEVLDKRDDKWFIPDRALELWGKMKFK